MAHKIFIIYYCLSIVVFSRCSNAHNEVESGSDKDKIVKGTSIDTNRFNYLFSMYDSVNITRAVFSLGYSQLDTAHFYLLVSDDYIDSTTTYKNIQLYLNDSNISVINNWCLLDDFISKLSRSSLGKDITFDEVFYNLDITKKFFKKYLNNPSQYYGSLDIQQSSQLYFDVLNYLAKSESDLQLDFMINYLKYIQSQQNK